MKYDDFKRHLEECQQCQECRAGTGNLCEFGDHLLKESFKELRLLAESWGVETPAQTSREK